MQDKDARYEGVYSTSSFWGTLDYSVGDFYLTQILAVTKKKGTAR